VESKQIEEFKAKCDHELTIGSTETKYKPSEINKAFIRPIFCNQPCKHKPFLLKETQQMNISKAISNASSRATFLTVISNYRQRIT